MPIQHARKRPSTADPRRYDAPFVVVAVRGPAGMSDVLAPPVTYRSRPRGPH
ncbi:hypothetical protein AB0M46_45050 [Dactylosporangium sp. NPDC051485]|uniref:hypothetical protein n=1 Tax=Dactylosporangium sp. NPDC051485 TaxID=3154846 RepID=UPI00343652BC